MAKTPETGFLNHRQSLISTQKNTVPTKIVRIHIPIRTNKDVVFTMYENDDDDDGEKLNLKTGHFYYLDVTKPHSVSNNSTIDRYHLVVDCYVNEELKAIL